MHLQLLYKIHEFCSLVVNDFLHISFIFFVLFVKHCFLFCSRICTLILFINFIMKRVLLTVHLVIRSCIFCIILVAFFTLLEMNLYKLSIDEKRYKISIRRKCLQTLILLFKLLFNLISVIFTTLISLKTTSLKENKSETYLSFRHQIIDRLTNRNRSVYQLHSALLHFHMHNKLWNKFSFSE